MEWSATSLKSRLARTLTRSPRLFDGAKRLSRLLGDRSQHYEFLREFAAANPTCRFLQIGSNDGMINDPLREFVVAGRWTGILVEPVPYVFRRLQQSYRHRSGLRFENAAVSSASGSMRFYAVDEKALSELHSAAAFVGSFDKQQVLKHFAPGDDMDRRLIEIDVPTVTVAELLDRHGYDGIDLLHIDAEGHEPEILGSVDFERVQPQAIIFESRHLGAAKASVFDLLVRNDYRCFEINEDTIAVRNDLQLAWAEGRQPTAGGVSDV